MMPTDTGGVDCDELDDCVVLFIVSYVITLLSDGAGPNSSEGKPLKCA